MLLKIVFLVDAAEGEEEEDLRKYFLRAATRRLNRTANDMRMISKATAAAPAQGQSESAKKTEQKGKCLAEQEEVARDIKVEENYYLHIFCCCHC